MRRYMCVFTAFLVFAFGLVPPVWSVEPESGDWALVTVVPPQVGGGAALSVSAAMRKSGGPETFVYGFGVGSESGALRPVEVSTRSGPPGAGVSNSALGPGVDIVESPAESASNGLFITTSRFVDKTTAFLFFATGAKISGANVLFYDSSEGWQVTVDYGVGTRAIYPAGTQAYGAAVSVGTSAAGTSRTETVAPTGIAGAVAIQDCDDCLFEVRGPGSEFKSSTVSADGSGVYFGQPSFGGDSGAWSFEWAGVDVPDQSQLLPVFRPVVAAYAEIGDRFRLFA